MTDTKSKERSADRSPRVLAGPMLSFDLAEEANELRREEPWRAGGHNARTLVKHSDLRIVLVVLKTGAHMQEHHTDHRFSVQTLTGHVRLQVSDETIDLPSGSLLVLDKAIPHDVLTLEDSAILISMSLSTE